MQARNGIRSTLLALATVLLLSQALGRAAEPRHFGFSADFDVARLELRFELILLCVRMEAASGGLVASAHFLSCSRGACGQPRGRWS